MVNLLRELYHRAEDLFYHILDVLDAHNIPVYKIHDWLDERGIPPFPAFLTLIGVILTGVLLFFLAPSVPQYSLYVYVVGPDGESVPYATVEVYVNGDLYSVVTTDELGYAKISPVPEGTVQIRVSAEGYKQKELTLEILGDTTHEITLSRPEDEMGETYGVLTLIVTDYIGKPLDADVLVYLPDGRVITKATEEGRAKFTLPIGLPVEVTVKSTGYEEVTKTYTLEQAEATLTITLPRRGDALFTEGGEPQSGTLKNTLRVRVLSSGLPVENAQVTVYSVTTGSRYYKTTNTNGYAEFLDLPASDYQIDVYWGGKRAVSSVFFLDSSAEIIVDIETGSSYLRVQVLDENGRPLRNKTVEVKGVTVTTDDEGYASVPLSLFSSTSEGVSGKDTGTSGRIYSLTVKVSYNNEYMNTFEVYVKGPVETSVSTTSGTAFLLLPDGVYTVKVKAYGEEHEKTVELVGDRVVEFSLVNPKARIQFVVPYPGILEIAGQRYNVEDKIEVYLPPGEYGYTYITDGYAEYRDTINVRAVGDMVVKIPKDVLSPLTYIDGDAPVIKSLRVLYGGMEFPAIVSGASLEVVIDFPKMNSATVEIGSPSPLVLLGGKQVYSETFTPPKPSERIVVPVLLTGVEDIVEDFRIIVKVGETQREFVIPLVPFPLRKIGHIFYAGNFRGNVVEAPNGKVNLPLVFIGTGEVVLRFNNDEVRIPLDGYYVYTVNYETNYPSKIVIEFYEGGIKTGSTVLRVVPKRVVEPPEVPQITDVYFVFGDVPTGSVLLPGGYLYVRALVPEGTRKAVLSAMIGYDYIPAQYQPNFGGEHATEVEEVPENYVVEFTVPVDYTVASDFYDLPLKLRVEAIDDIGSVIPSEEHSMTVYATRTPFKNYTGTSLWFSLTYDGSPIETNLPSGPGTLVVSAFDYAVGGRLEVNLATDIDTYTTSLEVDALPSSATISYEAYKYAHITAKYVINDVEIPLLDRDLTLTERTFPVELCFTRGKEPVEGVNVSLSGRTFAGDAVKISTTSGENGCTTISVAPGEYDILATSDVYLPVEDSVVVVSPVSKTYELVPEIETPLIRFKGIRENGRDVPSLSVGNYQLVFEVSLSPEQNAVLTVTSLSNSLLIGGSKSYTIGAGIPGRTVEVTIPVSVSSVEYPYSFVSLVYKLEVNEGGTTITIPSGESEGAKLVLPVTYEKSDCSTAGVGVVFLTKADGNYTRNILFDGESGDIGVLALSCSYDGSADIVFKIEKAGVPVTEVRTTGYFEPYTVNSSFTSVTLTEGTYSVGIYVRTSDGADLLEKIERLVVYGPRTVILSVSPVSILQKTEVKAVPNRVLEEPDAIKVMATGGPGLLQPVAFRWAGSYYSATVVPTPRGGDIVVECQSELYNCVTSPSVIYASRETDILSYKPTVATIPLFEGSNEVEVLVRNGSALDLEFVGFDLQCNEPDAYRVSIDFPSYLSAFSESSITIGITQMDKNAGNLECNVLSTWSYEDRGGKKYVTSFYSFETTTDASVPSVYFTPPSVELVRGVPTDINLVVEWTANVAHFAEIDVTYEAPEGVEVIKGDPIAEDSRITVPVTVFYTGTVPNRKMNAAILFKVFGTVGKKDIRKDVTLDVTIAPYSLPLELDAAIVYVYSFTGATSPGEATVNVGWKNTTKYKLTVVNNYQTEQGDGWKASLSLPSDIPLGGSGYGQLTVTEELGERYNGRVSFRIDVLESDVDPRLIVEYRRGEICAYASFADGSSTATVITERNIAFVLHNDCESPVMLTSVRVFSENSYTYGSSIILEPGTAYTAVFDPTDGTLRIYAGETEVLTPETNTFELGSSFTMKFSFVPVDGEGVKVVLLGTDALSSSLLVNIERPEEGSFVRNIIGCDKTTRTVFVPYVNDEGDGDCGAAYCGIDELSMYIMDRVADVYARAEEILGSIPVTGSGWKDITGYIEGTTFVVYKKEGELTTRILHSEDVYAYPETVDNIESLTPETPTILFVPDYNIMGDYGAYRITLRVYAYSEGTTLTRPVIFLEYDKLESNVTNGYVPSLLMNAVPDQSEFNPYKPAFTITGSEYEQSLISTFLTNLEIPHMVIENSDIVLSVGVSMCADMNAAFSVSYNGNKAHILFNKYMLEENVSYVADLFETYILRPHKLTVSVDERGTLFVFSLAGERRAEARTYEIVTPVLTKEDITLEYRIDVTEACGEGCTISSCSPAHMCDNVSLEYPDLVIKVPGRIGHETTVRVVLLSPGLGNSLSLVPISVKIRPIVINEDVIISALEEAVNEDSSEKALDRITAYIKGIFTEPDNLTIEEVLPYAKADVDVEKVVRYLNTLDARGKPENYAILLETDTEKTYIGSYVDKRIVEEFFSPARAGLFTAACIAGTTLCELKLGGLGLVKGAVEGAIICGMSAGTALLARERIAEGLQGDVLGLSLAGSPLGYIGMGVPAVVTTAGAVGRTKYLKRMLEHMPPEELLKRAVEVIEGKKSGLGLDKSTAEQMVRTFVERMRPYVPEWALTDDLAKNARLLSDPETVTLLSRLKDRSLEKEVINSLKEAIKSGSPDAVKEELAKLVGGSPDVARAFFGEAYVQTEKAYARHLIESGVKDDALRKELLEMLEEEGLQAVVSKLNKAGYKDLSNLIKDDLLGNEDIKEVLSTLVKDPKQALDLLEKKNLPDAVKKTLRGIINEFTQSVAKTGTDMSKIMQKSTRLRDRLIDLGKTMTCPALGFVAGSIAAAATAGVPPLFDTLYLNITPDTLTLRSPHREVKIGG